MILVAKDGRSLYQKGFGVFYHHEQEIPVTESSCMTWLLIPILLPRSLVMKLVDEGEAVD